MPSSMASASTPTKVVKRVVKEPKRSTFFDNLKKKPTVPSQKERDDAYFKSQADPNNWPALQLLKVVQRIELELEEKRPIVDDLLKSVENYKVTIARGHKQHGKDSEKGRKQTKEMNARRLALEAAHGDLTKREQYQKKMRDIFDSRPLQQRENAHRAVEKTAQEAQRKLDLAYSSRFNRNRASTTVPPQPLAPEKAPKPMAPPQKPAPSSAGVKTPSKKQALDGIKLAKKHLATFTGKGLPRLVAKWEAKLKERQEEAVRLGYLTTEPKQRLVRGTKRKSDDSEDEEPPTKKSRSTNAARTTGFPEGYDGTAPPCRPFEIEVEESPADDTAAPASPVQPENAHRKSSVAEEAIEQLKKAGATNDTESATPAFDVKCLKPCLKRKNSDSDEAAPAPKKQNTGRAKFRGLTRPLQSCFANSAVQMLDAALGQEDLIELHGKDRLRPVLYEQRRDDKFGWVTFSEKSCLENRNCKALYRVLKDEIRDQASRGRLSLSIYVGQLLKDLRAGEVDKKAQQVAGGAISPFLLQQVFAYSKKEHEYLDGSEMQDSSEWLLKVLDEVFDEHPSLRHKFQVKQETQVRCTAPGCSHSHALAAQEELTLGITLPEWVSGTASSKAQIQELISEAFQADTLPDDYVCDGCKKTGTTVKEITSTELPENLLVQVDRVKPGTTLKNVTPIEHAFGDIMVDGQKYQMAAWVSHESSARATECGHYVCHRQHDGKWWVTDDDHVYEARDRDLVDNEKRQTSLLLLKKVKQK
ncbi:hypothetical protein KC340_g9240 [Hortaea werneckii]|nr:hypothetical protein KC342_g9655 [Hortaea werneckii]KAI7099615.1 hypothetical protein KC339_g8083 [Hortaea werneckii]KAI7232741.1 hypothetical protein KC365_g6654 [Hortaea werneckii]KAI7314697.1 hypothetical protein KC340_g9240 [Hortaea werneckii]KAI7377313.1 hypothetical protein KC328_g14475 [Hortaea werneckii]